jgi:hypothetical protein
MQTQSCWVGVSKPKEAKAGPFVIHFLGCTSGGWQTGLKRKIELIGGHPVFEDGSGSPHWRCFLEHVQLRGFTFGILPSSL